MGGLIRPNGHLDSLSAGVSGAYCAHFPCAGRIHARLPLKRLRIIHRLASSNGLRNCAVFLARPR
jgi:hypothetical protein